MKLKNVIIECTLEKRPDITLNINPDKHSSKDTIVICASKEAAKEWQEKGYAVVGIIQKEELWGLDYVIEEEEGIDDIYLNQAFARFHNIPADICETKRLYIREMSEKDIKDMYKLYSGNVLKYVESLKSYEEELEAGRAYIKNMYGFYGYGLWLVFEKETDNLIGRAGIFNRDTDLDGRCELGYLIGEEYQGRGYAYEACSGIIKYAFENLLIDRLFLTIKKENVPSVRLAHKLGFELYEKEEDNLIYTKNIADEV